MKTALVAGSTGLTGNALLLSLLADTNYHQVYSVVRQHSGIVHDKLVEIKIDFDRLAESLEKVSGIDEVFCCLGSTMKKAGSKENFRRVDYTYPLALAKWSQDHGVNHFLCISALGADQASGIFYNKVKGEMERDVSKLSIPRITFFRPSLLLGNRKEKRPMEKLGIVFAKTFSFLFIGPLKKYKAIDITKVVAAMKRAAAEGRKGIRIMESEEMAEA